MIRVGGKLYNISIRDSNGNERGFKTVRRTYRRQPVNDFAPKYSTGDDQFAEGQWSPWTMNDWSGGLDNAEKYDNAQQNKFYSAESIETRITGRATLGGRWVASDAGKVATANPIDFAGSLYVPCGTALRKFAGTWSTGNAVAFGANVTHLHVNGANLFIALGESVDAQKTADGAAFTTLTAFKFSCWASYSAKLWGAKANHIYGSTDAGGTFATDVTIGDASSSVCYMVVFNQKLYIGKDDGLWYYDGSNVVPVLAFTNQAWTGNFKFMCEFGGALYFNILRRIIRFTPTTWNDITPTLTGDNTKELYGYGIPVMFCGTPNMLLVALDDGEGTLGQVLGYTGTAWHQIYGSVSATMCAVGYSRANDWIVVNDGATRYQAQISQADRCAADYNTIGTLVSPWFDGGFPWFRKSGKSVVIETRETTSDEAVYVDYATDGAATWNALSGAIQSPGVAQKGLAPIAGAIEFYKIRLRQRLVRGSTVSKRPVVMNVTLNYLNRPERVYSYSVQVRVKTQSDRQFLDDCANSTIPLIFKDLNGIPHTVFIARHDEVKVSDAIDYAVFSITMIDANNGILVFKEAPIKVVITGTISLNTHTATKYGTAQYGFAQYGS